MLCENRDVVEIKGVPQGFRSLRVSNAESEPGLALMSRCVD